MSDAAGFLSGMNGVGNFVSQQHEDRAERRDTGSGISCRAQCDVAKDCDSAQTAAEIVSEVDQIAGQHYAPNTLSRRQKKHRLTSRNRGECSTSVTDDSDIVILGSYGEPSNSRSSRIQTRQRRGSLGPLIEVDDLSTEMRQNLSHDLDRTNNDDSDARARQLEADEMLARELQEQLYNEMPVVGGHEVGSFIWMPFYVIKSSNQMLFFFRCLTVYDLMSGWWKCIMGDAAGVGRFPFCFWWKSQWFTPCEWASIFFMICWKNEMP